MMDCRTVITSSVEGVFNGELLLLRLPSQAHDAAVREPVEWASL